MVNIQYCALQINTVTTKINRTKIVVLYLDTGAFPYINQVEDDVPLMNREVISQEEFNAFG